MSFDSGGLFTVRERVKTIIETADLGCTVHASWGPAPAGPTVILDGGGWVRTQACGMNYTIRVDCTYGDLSGEAVPKVEELARQVWEVLVNAGYPIQTVPPVGTMKFGDREYPAVQMSFKLGLTPEA